MTSPPVLTTRKETQISCFAVLGFNHKPLCHRVCKPLLCLSPLLQANWSTSLATNCCGDTGAQAWHLVHLPLSPPFLFPQSSLTSGAGAQRRKGPAGIVHPYCLSQHPPRPSGASPPSAQGQGTGTDPVCLHPLQASSYGPLQCSRAEDRTSCMVLRLMQR